MSGSERWRVRAFGGTALLRAIERDVERAGLARVEILTVVGKYPCHFYERSGFVERTDLGDGQVILARAAGST